MDGCKDERMGMCGILCVGAGRILTLVASDWVGPLQVEPFPSVASLLFPLFSLFSFLFAFCVVWRSLPWLFSLRFFSFLVAFDGTVKASSLRWALETVGSVETVGDALDATVVVHCRPSTFVRRQLIGRPT